MEAAYGIGVRNRYALFLDDDGDSVDPYALLNNANNAASNEHANTTETASKKGSLTSTNVAANHPNKSGQSVVGKLTTTTTSNSKSSNQQQQPTSQGNKNQALSESKPNVVANQKDGRQNRPRNNQQQRSGGGNFGGGGGGGGGGNRENQENRTQRSPRNFEAKDDEFRFNKESRNDNRRNGYSRGPRREGGSGNVSGGGGGGGNSGFGNRGGNRFGKREFNRHSGSDRSGVKATEKREGGGAHNWGKVDDYNETNEVVDEVVNGDKTLGGDEEKPTMSNDGDNSANVDGSTGDGTAEQQEPKIDEPQLKTLDEYKREQEEKRVHTQFNIRKAGEGEDKSKWKKTYVLKKKPVPEEEEVEYEEIEVEEDTNKRRNRQVLDIEINFRPAEDGREVVRRGGPRGGHGGGNRRDGPPGGGRRNDNPDRRNDGQDRRSDGQDGRRNEGSERRNDRQFGGNTPRGGPGGNQGRRDNRRNDRGGRFQQTPKFDDPNDFPSLNA